MSLIAYYITLKTHRRFIYFVYESRRVIEQIVM